MAALPRPSRPSLPSSPQPSGPLPSIPIPKSRQSITPNSASTSATSLPQPSSARTASSSSIPTSASVRTSNTSVTSNGSQAAGDQKKSLRKTISYNAFPRPPVTPRTPNGASPTSSASTTPRASRQSSNLPNGIDRSPSVNSTTSRARSTAAASEDAVASPLEGSTTEDLSRGRQRPSSSHGKDKGNVVISVRVRPEKDANDGSVTAGEWMVDGRRSLISYQGREGGEYLYDNVFTTHDKNDRVYNSAARRLVRRVMEGYNGTVFAYGMTGTGKTYSMQGTQQHPGVVPSAITDIFSYIRETPHREFLLRVSYLEIYNEKIHDLLAMEERGPQPSEEIKLREDNKGNVYATPLKEEIVQSPTQLLRAIHRGDHARKTSSTQYNARSSRSHAVVQIVVESRERHIGTTVVPKNKQLAPSGTRTSTLSLIDLAGSERAAESKERREEGSHINRSLLTLGTVISKLSGHKDKNGQPTDKSGKHLPYRDSKLTRLLQPALSGGSLISILCTIQLGAAGSSAAAGNHVVETLNTLKFAARARNNIVSHAKRSEESHGNVGDAGSRALLDRYLAEIRELRKQLDSKNTETSQLRTEEEERERKEEEKARDEERVTELHLAQIALGDRIKHLNALILSSKSTGVNQMRSFSSLSLAQQRMSTVSNNTDIRSIRSSASTHTLDANSQQRNSGETITGPDLSSPTMYEDDEDINGQGDASKDAQIRALQTDLADKNRYIERLENRLAQARRSSKSRVSMTFQGRLLPSATEQGNGVETMLREKDAEISELREQLDDKERSLVALRSAARKRDTADLTPTVTPPPPVRSASSLSQAKSGSQSFVSAEQSGVSRPAEAKANRRTSFGSVNDGANGNPYRSTLLASRRSSAGPGFLNLRSSSGTTSQSTQSGSPLTTLSSGPSSPTTSNGPRSPSARTPRKRNHGVDEMTRMLDDMIRKKVEEEDAQREKDGGVLKTSAGGRSNSLNLLAMRDAPSPKQKRGSRNSTAPEGLGIISRINGADKEKPTMGKRRASLLREGQNVDTNGTGTTGSTPAMENSSERQSQAAAPEPLQPNISPKRKISESMPLPLRLKPGSPRFAQMVPSPKPSYTSSTNAAQQATEALRNFSSRRSEPEVSTDEETSNDTVASSTVGAPTINGDGLRGDDTQAGSEAAIDGGESSMGRVADIQQASAVAS